MENIRYTIRQGIQHGICGKNDAGTFYNIGKDAGTKLHESFVDNIQSIILFNIQEPINPKDNKDYQQTEDI